MILASLPRYYWDACIWIELITQANEERVRRCRNVLQLAESGKAEIWTSALTLAEVFKRQCGTANASLPQDRDRAFEDYIEKEFIKKVTVDVEVGTLARRLLRTYPELKKPPDAVHLASCLLHNLDELHTFDEKNLIKLDGRIKRKDRLTLAINPPPDAEDDRQLEIPTAAPLTPSNNH